MNCASGRLPAFALAVAFLCGATIPATARSTPAEEPLPETLEPVSPEDSEVPPPGDPAHRAASPEMAPPPSASSPDNDGAWSFENPAATSPVPSAPVPPFGAGAELQRSSPVSGEPRPELAPSFGDGAVLKERGSAFGGGGHTSNGAAERRGSEGEPGILEGEASPALAAPSYRLHDFEVSFPDVSPGADANRAMPPSAPPVQADRLALSLYHLRSELYGIRIILSGNHLLSHLVLRIDSARSIGLELLELSYGAPRVEPLLRRVDAELQRLRNQADAHDHQGMVGTVHTLEMLLEQLQTPLSAWSQAGSL